MKNNIYQKKKKELAHQKMKMKTLPQELIAQILSLLPVNLLVRFQCVSKLWFALINDAYFIKLHLNRSKERFLILDTDYPDDYSMVKFSNEDQFGTAVNIKRPHYNLQSTEIVSSCNGLVFIWSFDNESVEKIVIWNPLIRKYKKLPPKPLEKFIARRHSAFGYDQVNNDYKVLRLVKYWPQAWLERLRDERRIYSLEVYSLREHSWRMVEEEWPIVEPYTISNVECFSNGAFHWVVTSDETKLKKYHVTFDLSTEKFRVQAFPINYSSTKDYPELVDLGGWLCAFFPQLCEVWVMKEYGVSSSWTLLYTVEPAFSKYPPFVFSHDGEEVLTGEILGPNSRAESVCLYWYDIKRKTRRIVKIENVPDLYAPVVCVGSLILLNDADSDNYLQ